MSFRNVHAKRWRAVWQSVQKMKTLSAIANGYSDSLLIRAADVCIKECRKVVLMPREMPLSRIHLRNMSLAAEAGCVIVPPMLTFYNGSKSVDDMINHALGKALMHRTSAPPADPSNADSFLFRNF